QVSSSSPAMPPSPAMLIGSENDLGMAATRILVPRSIDEEKGAEIRPFISRSLSFTESVPTAAETKISKKRRKRSSDLIGLSPSGGGHSFREDVSRAVSDTYLITRLSLELLRYLGVGYRWIARFLALGCYSVFLFPGFVHVGYHYFFCSQIRRGIVYGDQPRNRLDLYLPRNNSKPKPVVAFVTGGAWIIGYKAWGSLLGLQLMERDVIVACIDYR
ncbi:hypothetical protein M569_00303, partial [Genlisea aurea]